uniref:Uncharacterized protein n=1 Tax=Chrysotila carterae TaxID=13221 RepID=A0A7S4B1Z5_CHRCT
MHSRQEVQNCFLVAAAGAGLRRQALDSNGGFSGDVGGDGDCFRCDGGNGGGYQIAVLVVNEVAMPTSASITTLVSIQTAASRAILLMLRVTAGARAVHLHDAYSHCPRNVRSPSPCSMARARAAASHT